MALASRAIVAVDILTALINKAYMPKVMTHEELIELSIKLSHEFERQYNDDKNKRIE